MEWFTVCEVFSFILIACLIFIAACVDLMEKVFHVHNGMVHGMLSFFIYFNRLSYFHFRLCRPDGEGFPRPQWNGSRYAKFFHLF